MGFTKRSGRTAAVLATCVVLGSCGGGDDGSTAASPGTSVRGRTYDAAALSQCTQDSRLAADTSLAAPRLLPHGCASYSSVFTRMRSDGTPVSIDYFEHWPSNGAKPKGVVVLIGGGELAMNLQGDPSTHMPFSGGGGNYVVRSAQMFAEAGYRTVSIDRPSDLPSALSGIDITSDADAYRLSVEHAVDLAQVLETTNPERLPVFLLGTSRGAASVVAQNRLVTGIGFTSPVTADPAPGRYFVGMPGVPEMQPGFVHRDTWIAWEKDDTCTFSLPANSSTLYDAFVAAQAGSGIATSRTVIEGSLRMLAPTGSITPSVCGPFDRHGFLGREKLAAQAFTEWLDARVAAQGANRSPIALYATVETAQNTLREIELWTLVRDRDGDPLSVYLPYQTTVLGGTVGFVGMKLRYDPPPGVSDRIDKVVMVVEDVHGAVSTAVITFRIRG